MATPLSMGDVFKQINTTMLDRRINSYSSLLVLDPSAGQARWHLRQPLSDLIASHWGYQHNVLISFSLAEVNKTSDAPHRHALIECITKLGIWAPLSKSVWYLSSPQSSKHIFQSATQPPQPGRSPLRSRQHRPTRDVARRHSYPAIHSQRPTPVAFYA